MDIYDTIKDLDTQTKDLEGWLQNNEVKYQELLETDPVGAKKLIADAESVIFDLEVLGKEKETLRSKVESDLKTGKNLTYDIDRIDFEDPFTEEGIANKTSKALSAIVGEDVDVTTGLDPATRIAVASLDNQNVDAYLAEQFGQENVKTVNVGGSPMRLVKEDGKKWKAVDEMGFSFNDLLSSGAFAASESFVLAGSLLGSIKGAAMTGGNVLGMATGGAAGHTAAGTIKDQFVGAILGVRPKVEDTLGKRSTEGLIGLGIEAGIGKAVGPIARRLGKGKVEDSIEELTAAQNRLNANRLATERIDVTPIVGGGQKKTSRLMRVAEDKPNSNIAIDLEIANDRLAEIRSTLVPKGEKPQALYAKGIANRNQDIQETSDLVALYNSDAARAYKRSTEAQLTDVTFGVHQDITKLGEKLFSNLQKAETKANALKDEVYKSFYQKTEDKISVDPSELARILSEVAYGKVERNPIVNGLITEIEQRPANARKMEKLYKRLENATNPKSVARINKELVRLRQISGNINDRQLNQYVKIFAEAYPEGGKTGATLDKIIAGDVSDAVRSYRDGIYRELGVMDEWNQTTQVYKQRLGFEEGQLGKFLKENFSGNSSMDPTQIVSSILRTPTTINDSLKAISIGNPQTAAAARATLQKAYLQGLGIADNTSAPARSFEFDPAIVRALYGVSKDGNPNEIYGELMVKKLTKLQQALKQGDISPSNLTYRDIDELAATMTEDGQKEVMTAISKRISAERRLDDIKNTSLMDIALKGNREVVGRGEFPKALMASNPAQAKKVLAYLPPDEQAILREDTLEHLFARYSPVGRNTDQLWNGKALLEDLRSKPGLRGTLEVVIGKDTLNLISDASVVMKALGEDASASVAQPTKAVINQAGVQTYLSSGGLLHRANNYWLRAAYGTGKLVPFLRNISSKKVSRDQYKKNVKSLLLGIGTTTKGIEALAKAGRYDPEWSAYLGKEFGLSSEETKEYQEKYMTEEQDSP